MSGSGGGDASVMDATNLLKGALGIGTRGSTSRVGDDTTPDLFTSDGSKKQSKAKINNKKAGKQQQQKRGDGKTARTSKKDGDNRSNSAGKDRSKSASKPRKQSSEKQQRGKNKSNNFAWSAFQTSPDPSSLPIPAFSSGGDVGGEASGGGANVNVNENAQLQFTAFMVQLQPKVAQQTYTDTGGMTALTSDDDTLRVALRSNVVPLRTNVSPFSPFHFRSVEGPPTGKSNRFPLPLILRTGSP